MVVRWWNWKEVAGVQNCICAWCHVSRLTKYEGTQGTHDCTKDDLCTSDFRFLWACLVYSGLKCGQTAARGISLSVYVRSVVACIGSPGPCLPAALPPRQLPPRPWPTVRLSTCALSCPGRYINLARSSYNRHDIKINRSSIGRLHILIITETTERSCAMKSHHHQVNEQPAHKTHSPAEALRPTRGIAHRRTRQSHSDIYRTYTGTLPRS
jgi:hypothetical protein